MAESRLHQLSERGQSVWIDYLSRDLLETGELARLMEEDAVVGVTSNPTIFQKALSQGDAYDEQLQELSSTKDDPKEIFLAARRARRRATPATCSRPVWDERQRPGRLRLDRGRPEPRLRHAGDVSTRRCACTSGSTGRTCYVKIPARSRACRRSRTCIARGRSINVTLIFSLAAHSEVDRGLPPRARAARRGRRRPVEGRARSRASSSRASTPRPTSGWRRSAATRADGQARDREREARLRALPRALLGRALGGARGEGRDARSAACGPPLRRRTRSTATSSTSRS